MKVSALANPVGILDGVIGMLQENTMLPRWSDEVKSHLFREDEKQALNGMIAWFMAQSVEATGVTVRYELFPKIAIFRGFEKAAKKDIKQETYDALIAQDPWLKDAIPQYVRSLAEEKTSKDFVEHLQVDEKSTEFWIYRAATAIATQIELEELMGIVYLQDDILHQKEEIQEKRMAKYKTNPVFNELLNNEKLMGLFRNFSKLRNQERWVGHEPRIKYNDLGHSYHVACENYTALLMMGESEVVATKGYFVGLFHDLAERWTGDFSSPMKDAIWGIRNGVKRTLRDATDDYEKKMLNQHVYSKLPAHMVKPFKEIMLEELTPEEKTLFKEADKLSAAVESRMQYAGSFLYFRHVYANYSNVDTWSSVIKKWFDMQTDE